MLRVVLLGGWLLGAAALGVAPFLDWYDVSFAAPGGETLADAPSQTGWEAQPAISAALVVIAVAAVAAAIATYMTGARWLPQAVCALAALAAGLALLALASPPGGEVGTLDDARNSFVDAQEEFDPTLGLGVALTGAVALLAAGVATLATGSVSATRKRCPDCAKGVAAEARVCRFCGYRFT